MADRAPRPPRVAMLGMTFAPTSGVRDYAKLLAAAASEHEQLDCSLHWLERGATAPAGARREIGAWRARLAGELAAAEPEALVLHYSAFAYSHRGIPIFLPALLRTLGRLHVPLVTVLHETAYPWRGTLDPREAVWALSHRAALIELMRRTRAAIVTTEQRREWLGSRRWLPRRRLLFAPVFSNLPEPPSEQPAAEPGSVGLFGWAYEGASMELVLDALRLLGGRDGIEPRLRLLGSPGPDSEAGETWRRAARARGDVELHFSGVLPAQQLADELARCEVLLAAARPGPTSKKGTIAASLASGRPLLALDGPYTWRALVDAGALALVRPEAGALADGLAGLLTDADRRAALGERGRAFAREHLTAAGTAGVLREAVSAALQTG